MKKIFLSLCFAMVAFLSASYVSANKNDPDYFYAQTEDETTYRRVYQNYYEPNCITFTGASGLCAYEIIPGVFGSFPYSIFKQDIGYWIENGYLRPRTSNQGIYISEQEYLSN